MRCSWPFFVAKRIDGKWKIAHEGVTVYGPEDDRCVSWKPKERQRRIPKELVDSMSDRAISMSKRGQIAPNFVEYQYEATKYRLCRKW